MGFRILDNILNDPERGSKKNSTRFLNHNHKLSKFKSIFGWCRDDVQKWLTRQRFMKIT